MDLRHLDGYPAVADFIASDPDGDTYIFRRFGRLAARQLLYLESEIMTLESKQRSLDEQALRSGDVELRLSLRTRRMFSHHPNLRQEEKDRLALSHEIDEKLEKYHQALLLQSRIARLDKPSSMAIKACRAMMLGLDGKDAKLGGGAEAMFDEEFEDDLVALAPRAADDMLSRFLKEHWPAPKRPQQPQGGANHPHVGYFEARSLALLANICGICIAASLLIGPIIILYFVTDPDARLALVVVFIILFAVGLGVSTGATRDAIFAATAAYTAVLVVFVSGDLGKARVNGK